MNALSGKGKGISGRHQMESNLPLTHNHDTTMIIHGDSKEELKKIDAESVDLLCTDPPYGYSFMGKAWDKALPDIEIFSECFRVLKPGAFAFVMSAPRSDVCSRMAILLEDAGFNINFTPIYHTYASGFPKAQNVHKKLTKDTEASKHSMQELWRTIVHSSSPTRTDNFGTSLQTLLENLEQGEQYEVHAHTRSESEDSTVPERQLKSFVEGWNNLQKTEGKLLRCEVCTLPVYLLGNGSERRLYHGAQTSDGAVSWEVIEQDGSCTPYQSRPLGQQFGKLDVICDQCATQTVRRFDGAYSGFQPKPAVEVVIVAMKPLSEKTYVDQALKNGKGITWLDDCRIPSETRENPVYGGGGDLMAISKGGIQEWDGSKETVTGRFSANLLVSDDVLNDGRIYKTGAVNVETENGDNTQYAYTKGTTKIRPTDSGSYSRFFSLDAWAQTLPFLAVPKASKSEKNRGTELLPEKEAGIKNDSGRGYSETDPMKKVMMSNHHPTVKPLKLMSYLITLGSRPGDTVLDPFCGSGTTILATKELGRIGIGIEREQEYVDIAEARLAAVNPTLI